MGEFCLALLPLSVILGLPRNSWTLPAVQDVAIGSVDMRHTLTWRPLAALCGTAVVYTVQFQGEFERTILNGSWLDAPGCQRIPDARCNLTSDLGSDSDYRVRVRAECSGQASPWARLSGHFNRRDTLLRPPNMVVLLMGDGLQVSFQHLPPTASVGITVWRQGQEHEASTEILHGDQTPLLLAALQERAVYCVQARTHLEAPHRRSGPTDTHCVTVRRPASDHQEPWKKPMAAMVTLVVMAVLLFAVYWSVGRCRAEGCHAHFRKEPLPFPLVATPLAEGAVAIPRAVRDPRANRGPPTGGAHVKTRRSASTAVAPPTSVASPSNMASPLAGAHPPTAAPPSPPVIAPPITVAPPTSMSPPISKAELGYQPSNVL